MHKGPKLSLPSRTYNITVNHRRHILSSTTGHSARYNDKTLIWYDEFLCGIHERKILSTFTFELLERTDQNTEGFHSVKYKGPWVMVDNGYLRWSSIMPPFKTADKYSEIRWSQWLESMQKDVECTFGILKGHFRILKTGIRLHGVEAADKIWLTCCALHNLLLEADGLSDRWQQGIPSDWEGSLGDHNENDVMEHVPNFALNRLHNPSAYDQSGMGIGDDVTREPDDTGFVNDNKQHNSPEVCDGCVVVQSLTFDQFRARLVEHFDILFHQKKIQWPSRCGVNLPTI